MIKRTGVSIVVLLFVHGLYAQAVKLDQKGTIVQVPALVEEKSTNQLRSGDGLPDSIAADGSIESEMRFQGSEGRLGATFLEPGQSCVEDQQDCDDASLEVLVQYQLERDGRFEQPGNRCPEFRQGIAKWMSGRIRHRIGSVFVKANLRLIAGESVRHAIPK